MQNKVILSFLERKQFQRYIDMYKLFLYGDIKDIEEKILLSFLKFLFFVSNYDINDRIKNIEIIHYGKNMNDIFFNRSNLIYIMNKNDIPESIYKYIIKYFLNKLVIINYNNGSRNILYIEDLYRIIKVLSNYELLTLNNNIEISEIKLFKLEINIMENNIDIYQYLIENAYLNNFDNEIIIEKTSNITLEDFKKYYLI